MIELADRIRQSSGWVCGPADFRAILERSGLGGVEELGSRDLGEPITDHRSSWVRLHSLDSSIYYFKTYDYPTARDRWRGLLRNTALAPSRARREWDALTWLRSHGFAAPEPMAVVEKRRRGWLWRSLLITRAWPGHPAHHLLPLVGSVDRNSLVEAIRNYVGRLHASGFRDGNMDLRNYLARRDEGTAWEIAVIDSPRYRITAPGRHRDRAARRDQLRLAASFASLGVTIPET